jgi:hypothetical protein
MKKYGGNQTFIKLMQTQHECINWMLAGKNLTDVVWHR